MGGFLKGKEKFALMRKEDCTLGVTALQECTAMCGFARCEVCYALCVVAVQPIRRLGGLAGVASIG